MNWLIETRFDDLTGMVRGAKIVYHTTMLDRIKSRYHERHGGNYRKFYL